MLNIAAIKSIVSPICKQYNIDRLFLFGSYARNEAREDSDVDLRVDRGTLTGFAYGAIVTEDVPDNSLVAGVPAKKIRDLENDV